MSVYIDLDIIEIFSREVGSASSSLVFPWSI